MNPLRKTRALLLVLTLAPTAAVAQPLTNIQGFVTDESGGALPGATIEIADRERGRVRTAVSNGEGFFAIRSVPSGTYDITASLSGFRTHRLEGVQVLVGQALDFDFQLGLATVQETVVVSAEPPLLEVGRGGAAGYVEAEEISQLPISGRDFVQFALLKPTVKVEPQRGGISLAGQRGINSGLTVDGAEAKSAFFGYGRGGEATENGGLVIAQESVREFQVVTSGYSAEAGRSGGGYINVVTRDGGNAFAGSSFLFFRDQRMVSRLPQSPLDAAQGIDAADERYDVDEFRRYNWGASLGGPIRQDRTHFFLSWDQTNRSQPFLRNIRGRGQYDAVHSRYPELLTGFVPHSDGAAAPDPVNGRTASGQFVRGIDNLILFAKVNHALSDRHALSVRYNFTDFARESDFTGEESKKLERTWSAVASVVSQVGATGVNEFRVQYAQDDLDRLSNIPDNALQADFRIIAPAFGGFGKPWWLPIEVDESKFEVRNRYSVLAGNHEIRLGFDLNRDDLSQFFAGNADGRYEFDSVEDFLNGNAARARIFFGDVGNPNFSVTQQTLGIYAQDSWSPNPRLTMNLGIRWDGTFNPTGIEHVLPEGRTIPDDFDNISPRFGFVHSLDNRSLIRGGAGLFYGRTPTLLFVSAHNDTGVFPRFGNAIVSPGDVGYVPLGGAIDNSNPPSGLIPALSHVDPDFEDPRTARANLGYERELTGAIAASLDVTYARSDQLASNIDANVPSPGRDAFGRPVYSGERLNPAWGPILVRASSARSDYLAVTAGIRRRFADGVQFQAHYTWSRDRSNDDNERSAGDLTLTDPSDPDYDWGLSSRDIPHRAVASGLFLLPFDILASGILTVQSGSPWTALDPEVGFHGHPGFAVGPFGSRTRAVIGGELQPVNGERNDAWWNLDLRLTKRFAIRAAQLEMLFEVFNVFGTKVFRVAGDDQAQVTLKDGAANPEFGLGSDLVGAQRQAQIGLRLVF